MFAQSEYHLLYSDTSYNKIVGKVKKLDTWYEFIAGINDDFMDIIVNVAIIYYRQFEPMNTIL